MKFSEVLKKMLTGMEARKVELDKKVDGVETVEEVRSLTKEAEKLNAEIEECRTAIIEAEKVEEAGEQRGAMVPQGGLKPLATYGTEKRKKVAPRKYGKYDTEEYRMAFMDYVLSGEKSELIEMRADATAKTTDIGAVIPTTIINKAIEKMTDFGQIYARINKTNYKGGVSIPINALKPTATWVGENIVVDKQKMDLSGSVTFAYNKLQVRVAVSLESDTVSLSLFEQTVSKNISEAMIKAVEAAVLNGTGSLQPLGITKDSGIPAAQVIATATTTLWKKYETWVGYLSKVPRAYRNRCVLIVNDADWNKYIVGMVDANGQPVARTTYGMDGMISERFIGKEVFPTEEYIASIDSAESGDVVGVFAVLGDYTMNSNMQMTYKRYFDEDTDEWISKSTLLADGKLGDKNGVVLIKKA